MLEIHLRSSNILFGFIVLIVFGLSSCTGIRTNATSTPIPKDPWLEDWFGSPTCSPPCFENVTPGVTTIQEAYNLLKTSFRPTRIEEPIWYESLKKYELSWSFESSSGRMVSKDDSSVVRYIVLEIVNGVEIQDLIDAFGQPTHIVMHMYWNGKCEGDVIYLDKGIDALTYPRDKKGECNISPELITKQILLFPTGKDGIKEALSQANIHWDENVWKGYGTYSYR